ncbi:Amino acid dehydrogenase family protein [Klebsormidium nitens]|uniref:Glutamate dehydrogenase n=1 Tax=Klebsormidium nitens TaxID=105231 RepID=A0A1Y1IPL5_KLENI|nr:Amino acid dehydrogenase family protein [Klebsormidium nitens]|eukprot:GAQ91419.1 Amino acid dehydrogenase family protein [Klebsormidium nitens]
MATATKEASAPAAADSPNGVKDSGPPSLSVGAILGKVRARDPHQAEFLQAVEEVLRSLTPVLDKHPEYLPVVERLVEPERVVQFRVAWLDDAGVQQVNRGFRVQFNQALGPYKGGLRFHPSVTLSIIKFLGFEQILKNSLTTLAMGGAKGGSDFDPRGKSDNEVMKFCQSFMTELFRHIGPDTDVPAGDINVGGREIGFLFGQYKRLTVHYEGVLTGKALQWGGSLLRPEATGYGLVYYAQEVLRGMGKDLKGMRCLVSGSGNVAQYTVEKLLHLGALPVTLSDSSGYIYEKDGFTPDRLQHVLDLKQKKRARISEYTKKFNTAVYVDGAKPWAVDSAVVAFPCATQNEVTEADAQRLVDAGVKYVFEGANMPSTAEAIAVYLRAGVVYGPAKAANAGGVAVSGLEMAQNSQRFPWSKEEVDDKLQGIMRSIYTESMAAAQEYGMAATDPGALQAGANIAGFVKVAEAMLSQGCV